MAEWAAFKPCKHGHNYSYSRFGRCRECNNISSKEYRKRHPDKRLGSIAKKRVQRVGYLRRNYKLTVDDFNKMLIDQAGLCALCDKPMMGTHDPVIDHISGTYVVRGLVHLKCNVYLSSVEDVEFKEAALRYLAEFEW